MLTFAAARYAMGVRSSIAPIMSDVAQRTSQGGCLVAMAGFEFRVKQLERRLEKIAL